MCREWGAGGRRALCDQCAPAQTLLALWPLFALVLVAALGLAVYFTLVKPQLDDARREREQFRQNLPERKGR
jgi:hypothetical protein